MYAESYLTDMLIKAGTGIVGIATNEDGTFRLDYGKDPTQDQMDTANNIVASFDYDSVETALKGICDLERQVTDRMIQEAIGGDTTRNAAWCGGSGGNAQEHMAWIVQQKAKLRATLPTSP